MRPCGGQAAGRGCVLCPGRILAPGAASGGNHAARRQHPPQPARHRPAPRRRPGLRPGGDPGGGPRDDARGGPRDDPGDGARDAPGDDAGDQAVGQPRRAAGGRSGHARPAHRPGQHQRRQRRAAPGRAAWRDPRGHPGCRREAGEAGRRCAARGRAGRRPLIRPPAAGGTPPLPGGAAGTMPGRVGASPPSVPATAAYSRFTSRNCVALTPRKARCPISLAVESIDSREAVHA
ncbi:hypothetical protein DOO78_10155 [Roseicella frigidaeris]|uniref:Uncharacterized protein n=1 Tax=Roseicella frigidaeris TaxID=2230885 RepID=A0A327MAA6_9PROT|nr:hypothetical protein DOO78_10155 [Roseicella frigidaeris]